LRVLSTTAGFAVAMMVDDRKANTTNKALFG
jgi:hypothetical protein